MKEKSVSEEEIRATEEYLKGYLTCEAFLRMNEYEECFFEQAVGAERSEGVEVSMARMKQFEIRHFILDMPNSNEKIILYLHYIDCEPIERCADIMNISRSSAFRLKKRALLLAANYKKVKITPKKVPILKFA